MNGKMVIEVLLALGDGDSMVIDGKEWVSYEGAGFDVEDLRDGGVVRVARREAVRHFAVAASFEVRR